MEEEYQNLYKRLVTDQSNRPKHFHFIMEYQHEYHRELAEQSGTSQPVPEFTEKLWNHWYKAYIKSLPHFRDAVYSITGNNDNFEVVYEHPDLKTEE
jgi:hypothetical protein